MMINRQNEKIHAFQFGRSILHFSFQNDQILSNFKEFEVTSQNCNEVIFVGPNEKRLFLEQFPYLRWDSDAEFRCLMNLASDAMMPYDQLIFHSVAVLVHNRVWLLTGPSGIGKSTQYRNLKKLYSEEIDIISGDHPILSFEEDKISVYPSPWNGKENWRSMKTGRLEGIILLKQGHTNHIQELDPSEAVIPLYHELCTYAKTKDQIHLLTRLEERLLKSVPVWSFENTGDEQSSQLLFDNVLK